MIYVYVHANTDGGCLGSVTPSVTPRTSDAVRKMEKQRDLAVREQNDGDITIQRCRTSQLACLQIMMLKKSHHGWVLFSIMYGLTFCEKGFTSKDRHNDKPIVL